MSPRWEDVNARARGLSGHLLTGHQLEALGRTPDLAALTGALRAAGVVTAADAELAGPESLELAIRRWAAAPLATLGRWLGPRAGALPLIYGDEDRRSLRALFRGAVERAPAARRLAGLIPTPELPERALVLLAAAATPVAVSTLLTAWRHPWAGAIAPVVTTPTPDLLALDVVLGRAAAAAAVTAARRARHAELRQLVREAIDLENAETALAITIAGRDLIAGDHFILGGARLPLDPFRLAATSADPVSAGRRLASAFAGTPFAGPFARRSADPAALADELVRLRLRALTLRVRHSPLGPVLVVWFALRLRAQVVDLQRMLWTVALGAPRTELASSLLSAAA